MPIIQTEPCDPAIHKAAMDLAKEIVRIFSGILMEAERAEALTQSYLAAREILEAYRDDRGRS